MYLAGQQLCGRGLGGPSGQAQYEQCAAAARKAKRMLGYIKKGTKSIVKETMILL